MGNRLFEDEWVGREYLPALPETPQLAKMLQGNNLTLSRTPPNQEILTSDAHTGPCFTLANRVRRALWGVVYALLFRPSPRPFHGWRAMLLRLFGARIGRGVHVYGKVRIWAPWNLEIGDESGVADDAILYSMAKITLGKRVVVSQGAHLCCGTHDFEDPNFPLLAHPIIVGDRAWIAAEAFVCPGVRVGEGAVVAARSVVTKDVPEWTVVGGNPCKAIKVRKQEGSV